MSQRLIALLLISWSLAACQGKNQERKQAPMGPKDTGVLIEAAQKQDIDAVLKAYPNAQVRKLNPAHGLYEIFGVSKADIAKVVPQAQLTDNAYFSFKPMSIPGPKGLTVEGMSPCKEGATYPTAVATVTAPAGAPNAFSIELGTKVKISAAASRASVERPGQIKTALVLMPPGASRLEQSVTMGQELEIQPDALGVYQMFLVVQDASEVCALDAVQFLVTANRPYVRVSESGRLDLNMIPHLKLIDAQQSWARSQGEGILIAIIDTGVNYNHPLLSANMNSEIGHDFINDDDFPYDDDGHGTHVAGLAAARQMGMAQRAKILAVKSMTSIGGDAGSIAAGVQYAVDKGARVINMSLGTTGPEAHPLIVRAMDYAREKGALVVVASGNGDPQTGLGFDIDQTPVYPASLEHNNILSVAASDSRNALTPYSNFGKDGVDITAPGGFGREPIVSTAFENPSGAKLVGMSGTSMASPIVAGIAAQVWSLNPHLTNLQVKELLMKAGPEDAQLRNITVSGRHLNANTAVGLVGPTNVLF